MGGNAAPAIHIEIRDQEPNQEKLDGGQNGKVERAGVLRTMPPWKKGSLQRGGAGDDGDQQRPSQPRARNSVDLGEERRKAIKLHLYFKRPGYRLDPACYAENDIVDVEDTGQQVATNRKRIW